MVNRIIEIRKAFRKALEEEGAPGKWNHVTDRSLIVTNMSQLDANKNRQKILDTWKDVVDDKTPTNW